MDKLATEYLELPDIKIAFQQYGNGPILILLHGNSQSKRIFRKYQKYFFKNYHSIAIDSRGHGESVSEDDEYSIDKYSDDIIKFCEVTGIEQAFVIGYSDGGNISLLLAKKAPHIFTKIIAISPNYLVSGKTDEALRFLNKTVNLLRFLSNLGIPTQKTIRRFWLMLNDIGISDQELSSIQTNLKILYAEEDLIKEEHINKMGALIPKSCIQKINCTNHRTILNHQETIAEIKEYFLQDDALT
ncbi:MAG TPA: alpha/beta fold hydrolase [Bacillota bacterium]|nr:alpha/beta fold hydrolase [Bacillota bacterium]